MLIVLTLIASVSILAGQVPPAHASTLNCLYVQSLMCDIHQEDCFGELVMEACITVSRQWKCVFYCYDEFGAPQFVEESPWQVCCCASCPPGSSCDCLVAGTPVTMADGSTKSIELIEVGDHVLSLDPSSNQPTRTVVTKVHKPFRVKSYMLINGVLAITAEHPVLSAGNWVEAGSLQPGDLMETASGAPEFVESVVTRIQDVVVHNIQVESGVYIAGDVVVHNKEDCLSYAQHCSACE